MQHSPSLLIFKYYLNNIEVEASFTSPDVEAPLTHVEGAKKGKWGRRTGRRHGYFL